MMKEGNRKKQRSRGFKREPKKGMEWEKGEKGRGGQEKEGGHLRRPNGAL